MESMETRVHPCLQRISQVEVRFRRPDGADRCIVSVHDESLPRKKWRMGVVHELIKEVNKKTRGSSLSALLTRERVHIYGVLYSPCFPLWNPLSKLVSVRRYRACALLSELKRNNSEQHSILFTCNSRVYFVAFHFSVQVFELVIDNKTVFKLLEILDNVRWELTRGLH